MKKFIIIQVSIIIIGITCCIFFTSNQMDAGIANNTSYNKIKSMAANMYVITEDDVVLEQPVTDYLDFINGWYEITKDDYSDKQILIITTTDNVRLYNGCIEYEIEVKSVIDGDENWEGQKTTLISNKGFYYETSRELDSRLYGANLFDQNISEEKTQRMLMFNVAGLNIMQPNREYLIFAESIDFDDYSQLIVNIRQFVWMEISDRKSEVVNEDPKYNEYSDNEIFTNSQEVLNDYYLLKKKVFEYYKISV